MPVAGDSAFATGRWSFLTADPFGVFRVRQGQALWDDAPLDGTPLEALRRLIAQYHVAPDPDDPTPFRGGCAGYIAYDFAWGLERLAMPTLASGVEDMVLGFHDVVAALDHMTGRIVIYASGFPETGPSGLARAKARGEAMRQVLLETSQPGKQMGQGAQAPRPDLRSGAMSGLADDPASDQDANAGLRFHASHDRAAWMTAVERVREYIRAGDIFQANIARRFSAVTPAGFSAFDFYQALRLENPAPFAAFLDFGNLAIASSSPERFVALRNGQVETRPIKGTARRNSDPAHDAAAAAELLASEKDRAENVMIVDLLRNDLSRVCAPGTVGVDALCVLESYANVHHLVSVVSGRLAAGRDAIDLIAATFPGGSITGAPKIRAMDIITEIEGAARGVYCGAIGYIGFDGGMDFNIAIRTVAFGNGEAVFQAGGGITLLSDPEAEFAETEDKAARLFSAFTRYGRGGACS